MRSLSVSRNALHIGGLNWTPPPNSKCSPITVAKEQLPIVHGKIRSTNCCLTGNVSTA